jgi:hypothetical protein
MVRRRSITAPTVADSLKTGTTMEIVKVPYP